MKKYICKALKTTTAFIFFANKKNLFLEIKNFQKLSFKDFLYFPQKFYKKINTMISRGN